MRRTDLYQIAAVVSSVGFASYGPAAVAQEIPPRADDIVVEGTRLGTPLSDTIASVTVLSADDLATSFVADALATVPGVELNRNGAFGGLSEVRLRGATAGQTLVLVDGVPVGDPASPGGGTDLGALDPAGIGRIEILRGPQSVLWGADAIGGVINIKTARAEDGLGLDLVGEVGSFETFRGAASVSAGRQGLRGRLGVSGITSRGISKAEEQDGNPEEDGFQSRTVSGRAGTTLPGGLGLDVSFRDLAATTDLDGFPPPAFALGDTGETVEREETSISGTANLPLFGGKLVNTVQVAHFDLDRQNFAEGDPTFGAAGERTTLRYQGTLRPSGAQTIAIGATQTEQAVGGEEVAIVSLFGLWRSMLGTRLSVSAGARLDDHDTFGTTTTGQAGIRFEVTEGLSVRARLGTGFKAPTIFQLTAAFDPRFPPNSDLSPETSVGGEIAFSWERRTNGSGVEVTVFANDVQDQIDFSFTESNYQNVEEVQTIGVEAIARAALTAKLTLDGTYTYLQAEDGDGQALDRLPEHRGSVYLRYAPTSRFSSQIGAIFNGDESDPFGVVDGWTRVDARATYDLGDGLEIYVRAENITDEDYQEVLGYGTPGASAMFGLKASL